MGNVINLPSESDISVVEQKDREFLELPCSSVFSDEYVANVYRNLPNLDGEPDEDDKKTTKQPEKVEVDANLQRVIDILAPNRLNAGSLALENFQKLSIEKEYTSSPFSASNKQRARLLLRIHQAFLRQAKTAGYSAPGSNTGSGAGSGASTGSKSNFFSSSKKVSSSQSEDPGVVLAAMNASMCLSIAKTIGRNYPELAINMSHSLVDILKALGPASLKSSDKKPSHLLLQTVNSVFTYASELEASSTGELRSVALGLMLVVASAIGSVEYALATVTALTRGQETLSADMLSILEDLSGLDTDLNLSIPTAKTVEEKLKIGADALKTKIGHAVQSSAMASDGSNLFVWDEAAASLKKFGTGANGTIQGEELARNDEILQQIQALRGDAPATSESEGAESSAAAAVEANDESEESGERIPVPTLHPQLHGEQIVLDDDLRGCYVALSGPESVVLNVEYGVSDEVTGNYFEVEVISSGGNNSTDAVGVGLCNTQVFNVAGEFPGWHGGSYGYHGDNGQLYGANNCGVNFGTFSSGSVVGCGFNSSTRTIFYTLNGNLLSAAAFTNVAESSLTPVVTFQGNNNRIRINPGSASFVYNGPEVVFGRFASAAKQSASKRPQASSASITFANRKIYFRSQKLLGLNSVAQFNSKSLKLEAIREVKSDAIDSTQSSDSDDVQTFTYNYEHTDVVDIRASESYSIRVKSATFHEADCTETVTNLLSTDQKILHFNDLVGILGDPAPGMPKQLVIQVEALPITLSLNDPEREKMIKVGDALVEGLTSDGRNLIMLNHRSFASGANKQPLFSCLRDVEITSCHFYDTNFCGTDVSAQVRLKFEEFLNSAHTASYEKPKVSNEWISDPQAGVMKTLWINFTVGKSVTNRCISFVEGSELDLALLTEVALREFSGVSTVLEAVVVDPLSEMTVVQRSAIIAPASMYASHASLTEETSLLSNGQKLIVQQVQHGGRVDLKRTLKVFRFDISKDEAKLLDESTEEYLKAEFFPSTFAYDSITNSTWSWDVTTRTFARWRNVGLRPRSGESSRIQSLTSSSPSNRLAALWPDASTTTFNTFSAVRQAATLSAILDKLSEPYGPGIIGAVSEEIDPISEIEVASKCQQNGQCGFSSIKVRGICFGLGLSPDTGVGRGYNFVTLTSTFTVDSTANFDTSAPVEVDKMINFITAIPDSVIVIVSVNNSAVQNMTKKAFDSLRSLGADVSKLERSLASGVTFEPFCMIGRKGTKPGTAIQKIGATNSVVKIRQKIPAQAVPLMVEPTKSNISYLTRAVIRIYRQWKAAASKSEEDAAIIISFMRILMVNIYQLAQGVTEAEALEQFAAEDRNSLRDLLMEIIDSEADDKVSEAISKSALNLFVEALNLLYPSSLLRQQLLQNYLKQYNDNTLSAQENKVLELLLKRISSPKELACIVNSDDTSSITSLLTTLMSILRTELPKKLQAVIQSKESSGASTAYVPDAGSLGEASVALVSSLSKMLLSRAAQEIVLAAETQSLEGEIRGKRGGFTLVTMVATMVSTCCDILAEAITTLQAMDATQLDGEVDELLRSSLVGTLVPFFLGSTSLLLSSHGMKMLQWVDSRAFSDLHAGLASFSKQLQVLIALLPTDALHSSSSSRLEKVEKMFESEHPYANSLDSMIEISIPGASKMTITFDPASRTENGCDYVRFLDDSGNVLHPAFSYFTGRDGSQNWPGCEGRAPLELEVGSCKLHFHTDGSVNDWGWKFTVSAELPKSSSKNVHWLVSLSNQLVHCKTALATTYINSIPWNEALEDPLSAWMSDSLIQPDLFSGKFGKSEEDLLLVELIDRPLGSLAETLVSIMRKKVHEDRGSDDSVNRAVYATCAALIKHNNLAPEALALAKKTRTDVSQLMVKAWTAAQKMRSYFDLADLRFAQGTAANPSAGASTTSRQDSASSAPSLYSGADDDVLAAATQAVVARAQFLIRSAGEEDEEEILEPSSPRPRSATSLSKTPSYLAKQRWGLLAKSEGLKRQNSGEVRRGSWGNLVTNLVVSEKVKSILAYRRKAASRKKGKQSISERVLAFIQSRVDIEQLEQLNVLRSKRAAYRSSGISLLATSLDPEALPFSLSWIFYSFAHSLRHTAQGETATANVHYGVIVEGSNHKTQDLLASSFGEFIQRAIVVLEKAKNVVENPDTVEIERQAWKSTIIACIRALAIDYHENDHPFLDRTNLLELLASLTSWEDDEVREVAQALFEVLVTRCVGGSKLVTETGDASDPSSFSLKLVDTVVTRVKSLANALPTIAESTEVGATKIAEKTTIIRGVKVLRNEDISPGYSYPHFPVGLQHTFSLWIKRPRSSKIDSGVELKANCVVIRGTDWHADCEDDGGLGNFGTVVSIDGSSVKVSWTATGKSGVYKYGEQEDGSSSNQIALADPSIAGHIYSKGSPALFKDDAMRKKVPSWALFGLKMLGDGSLASFISAGRSQFLYNRSASRVSPDAWTQVTVVQRSDKSYIYINGVFDSTITLEEHLFNPVAGAAPQVVESPHPYLDGQDIYQVYDFPGASKLTITFDEQTRTEGSYDYIKFYKNESRSEFWGENYSGGRSGSARNFPGLDSTPPLVIPSNSVCFHFHSDGSNNDWGYKFTIQPDGSSAELSFSEENLNNSPLFIGHGPIYSSSHPSFNGQIANLEVHRAAMSATLVSQHFESSVAPLCNITAIDDKSGLAVLSQLLKGLSAVIARQQGVNNSLERALTSPQVLHSLFSIAAHCSPMLQSAAFRILAAIVPKTEVTVVDDIAASVFSATPAASFVHYLFAHIGSTLDASPFLANENNIRCDHEFSFAVAIDCVNLLRSLALTDSATPGNGDWRKAVSSAFKELVSVAVETISAVSVSTQQEDVSASKYAVKDVVGLLAFVGGALPGIYPGAQCMHMDDKGIPEQCTVIMPTAKPEVDPKDKEAVAKWEGIEQHGEAVVIVLASQPEVPITVSRESLSVSLPSSVSGFSTLLSEFFEKDDSMKSELIRLYHAVSLVDTRDPRPVLQPNKVSKEVEVVYESNHPYADCMDAYTTIEIPGATSMTVTFDSRSRTEMNCDYVRFYKDSRHTEFYGVSNYMGRDGSQNFPGCNGEPPLEIPSGSAELYFHSDGSGNDWGYHITVTGTSVVADKPPKPPVLPGLLVLRYWKMMGLRSISAAIESSDWFAKVAFSMAPDLFRNALYPLPSSATKAKRKPLVLESKHPYDNSMDEYTPVRLKGAKKLSIVFDPMSATESGCDYLRLYTNSSHTTMVPGAESLTGGKDGGSSNWPGIQGRPPLIVDGDSFEIYFHSDGSVNAWGWKMTISELGSNADAEDEDPSAEPGETPSLGIAPDQAALNFYYLWELSSGGMSSAPVTASNAEELQSRYTSKPAPQHCAKYITYGASGGEEESKSDDVATDSAVRLPSTLSSNIKVNLRPVWPRGYSIASSYSEAVTVFADRDTESTVVHTCRDRDTFFLASEAVNEWVKVTVLKKDGTAVNSDSETVGWALLRAGDRSFLTRDDTVPGCVPELVLLPTSVVSTVSTSSSSTGSATSAASTPTTHPMYEIDDKVSSLASGSTSQGVNPMDLMRAEQKSVLSAMTDAATVGAIGYAHMAISKLLTKWPQEQALTVDSLGGFSNLLSYMLITYDSEDKMYIDALNSLKALVLQTLRVADSTANELCKDLISFSKSQLTSTNSIARIAPSYRGLQTDVESQHPYQDNMNQPYPVTLPGAKYLLLVFDPRSATETNCDYIEVTDASGTMVGNKVHGRVDFPDKYWPGVGTVPPMKIPGDKCTLTFKSDGGVVDWGFKVTVYGVVEEPTEEELKDYSDYVKAQQNTSLNPDFACWLLNLLSREHSPVISRLLYTADTIKSLSDYFKTAIGEKKTIILQLISNMLQSVARQGSCPPELLEQISTLRSSVLDVATTLYKAETNNGSDMMKISKLLQLCVQVIVIIDSLLDSVVGNASPSSKACTPMLSLPSVPSSSLPADVVALDGADNTNLHAVDNKGQLRWLPEGLADNLETANARRILRRIPVADGVDDRANIYSTAMSKYGYDSGVHSWNIKVTEYVNGEPIIGVAMLPISPALQIGTSLQQNDVGWGNQSLFVRGFDPVPFGPKVSPGDVISITVDVGKGTVTFFRNSACVGLAVGPANSGAVIETAIGAGPFYPVVSLRNLGDSVEFVEYPLSDSKTGSGSSSAPVPEWLRPLKDVVATMRSCLAHEVPTSVLTSRFLPTCIRKAIVSFDCADVTQLENPVVTESVDIAGAQSLCVFFDDVQLGEEDTVRILDANGVVVFEKSGLKTGAAPGDVVSAAGLINGDGAVTRSDSSKAPVAVGACVVRGSDWCWDEQDGGVGCKGTVTAVQEWKGKANSGVQVKWVDSGYSGLYRWNVDGLFDLKLFEVQGSSGVAVSTASEGVLIPSSRATLEITTTSGSDVERHYNVIFVPKFTLQVAMTNPAFEPFLSFLRAQYIGGSTLQGDFSLVRHIDSVSKARDLSLSSLLTAKWESFVPTSEDLTRSAALKALVDSPLAEYPEGFYEVSVTKPTTRATVSVDPAKPLVHMIYPIKTDGTLSYSQAKSLAEQINGTLPSIDEINLYLEQNGAIESGVRIVWPTSTENEWVVVSDPENFSGVQTVTPEWADSGEAVEERCVVGVLMPRADGAPNCSTCGEVTVPSEYNGDPYDGGGFACDVCHCNGYGYRWLCLKHTSDLCFECHPLKLNGTVPVDLDATDDTGLPYFPAATCCALTEEREEGPLTFSSLEEAVEHNRGLEKPYRGIVFLPDEEGDDRYLLRDGELVATPNSTCVFLWRGAAAPSASSNTDEEQACEITAIPFTVPTSEIDTDAYMSLISALGGSLSDPPEDYEEESSGITYLALPSNLKWFFIPEFIMSSVLPSESTGIQCSIVGMRYAIDNEDQDSDYLWIFYCTRFDEGVSAPTLDQFVVLMSQGETTITPDEDYSQKVYMKADSDNFGLLRFTIPSSARNDILNSETSLKFRYGDERFSLVDLPVLETSSPCTKKVGKGDSEAQNDAASSGKVEIKRPDVEPTVISRFNTIRSLNAALSKALPLIDLTAVDQPGSIAALLSICRGLVFDQIKAPVWDQALAATAGSGGQFELRISRSRARKFAASDQVDHDARFMVFSQAFRQMHPMPPSQLRRSDKLYTAQFMGERAHDAGGPYRESFAMYAQDLQSRSLPLMLQTPNGRHAVGLNRDKWVLNPSSTSSTHLEMFAFLGKLMGIAIRSKEYLALSIPSLIWKLLVSDSPTLEDLEGVDLSLVKSMNSIRHIDQEGIDADTFSMTFFETFTTTTTDDRIVELVLDGATKDVTFENRTEYCDLVLKYRLQEFNVQAAAIRRGLATMVPASLLSLFSWNQLETMVCGNPDIDVKLLESVTEYSGCSANDAHVRLFWQALNEFNNEERSALIRFCWGRSRLPLNAAAFTQRFKLQSFNRSPADSYFPVAHTCFFSLELPAYSTLTIMTEKLRYAIFNCMAIDGDDTSTGMAVAAMGWEE